MSLTVWLTLEGHKSELGGSGIFVREDGAIVEITREEWDEKFPGREPAIAANADSNDTVFDRNITHNMGRMAGEAGIYQHLWRPEELSITKADELIDPLSKGLALLESDPAWFKAFNPENGWGSYKGLVEFVREYVDACREYPEATIRISR